MIAKIISDNDYEITSIEELIEFIQTTDCRIYNGLDDMTQPTAIIYPSRQPTAIVHIQYNDIIDCKRTESALRPFCSHFSPRKYMSFKSSSIYCSYGLKEELKKLKRTEQSFEGVIWDLIIEHYDNL